MLCCPQQPTHLQMKFKKIGLGMHPIFIRIGRYKQKSSFPKFQWIPILFCIFKLCVFHWSHKLLCCIKSHVCDFLWKLLSFHTEMISAWVLWGSVLLREELQIYAKNSHFENFESTLYLTSVRIPSTENQLSRNEMWYAADNHNYMCHICAKGFLNSKFH